MGSRRAHAVRRRRRSVLRRRGPVSLVAALGVCAVLTAAYGLVGGVGDADTESSGLDSGREGSVSRGQPGGREAPPPVPPPSAVVTPRLVPAPAQMRTDDADAFLLTPATRVSVVVGGRGGDEARRVAGSFARSLRDVTGYALPVSSGGDASDTRGIRFVLGGDGDHGDRDRGDQELGHEGYRLDVTRPTVTLTAHTAEGLFRGTRTLRQLLPAKVEQRAEQPGPWALPGVHVVDTPRFAWRGTMLDVARHFRSVADVKAYIDLAASYKLNVLHLHLTDDQGWRLAIDGWPRLTSHGAASEVGGGKGGFYTQEQYREIVRYAARRYVTVVPEVDMPGHTNAALSSYPELTCDGQAPEPYTGTHVGFSSLCTGKPEVRRFVSDVLGQLAALTPGPYLHVGGDEAKATREADYRAFMGQVRRDVAREGKTLVGWGEIADAGLGEGAVAQHWQPVDPGPTHARRAAANGARLVMSPADRVYLDMKYDAGTRLGTDWAGHVSVHDAYAWDPASLVDGVGEDAVLGVEAPLWSETLEDYDDVTTMALPRLPAVAEVGWSAADTQWEDFRTRLAAQAPRWQAQHLAYTRADGVPWPTG